MTTERIVHVVDYDLDVRRSLEQLLLSAGFTTVLYPSARALFRAAARLDHGCLLIDVLASSKAGLKLLEGLRHLGVQLPAIVVIGHGDVTTAVQAVRAGAEDFIERPFEGKSLIRALEAAAARSCLTDQQQQALAAAQRISTLSRREREVLDALVAGHTNKNIARQLGISVRTVEVHRANMFRRLATRSLAEAVRLVMTAALASGPH